MTKPRYRYDLFDYDCVPASDTYPGPPTNNDVQFAVAMTDIPAGGTLEIPPDLLMSPTGQFVGGFGHLNTIMRDRPLDIFGHGFASNLLPMAGFAPSGTNLLFNQSGSYWFNCTLHDFAIGGDCVAPQYRRNGGAAVWFKANDPGGMSNTFIEKLRCGESGNNHSVIIDGAGTQHCRMKSSTIWGGLHIIQCADNHTIDDTDFLGWSPKGVLVDMPGAYGAKFGDCVFTCVGGVVVQSGSSNEFISCTWEEQPGRPIDNAWLTGVNGLLVLCGCPNAPVFDTRILNCDLSMFSSISNANCIVTNQGNKGIARTHLAHNTLSIGNGLAAVYNSGDAGFVSGPNTWNAATRFKTGGIAPVQLIGGG